MEREHIYITFIIIIILLLVVALLLYLIYKLTSMIDMKKIVYI